MMHRHRDLHQYRTSARDVSWPYPIDEEALRKLKRLHDDGIIDDDEFRQGKA